MKIDIVCEFASLNGGENSMLSLLPLLQQRGVELRILAPSRGALADAVRAMNFELVPLDNDPGDSVHRRRERLGRVLWDSPPDLVHANSLSIGRLTGPVASAFLKPCVAHLRDIIRLNRKTIEDLNLHNRLFAVSEAVRSFHVDQGLYPSKTKVLYNGVDLERFRPAPPTGYLHEERGIDRNAVLLGVIGQIGLRKGQDQMFDWILPIFEQRPNIHLLVVGRRWSEKAESVDFEHQLQEKATKPPFQGRIHFLGVRNDIPELMNELTVLLHTARQEPLGRVLLEAAASGLCVLATAVGGTREIFPVPMPPNFDETAKVVPATDFDTFQHDLLSLLDSPALREKIASAARCRMENVFSREAAAENLYRHYIEVLDER